jgi:diketogulonate reductase-like aldo/keto reductase
MYRNEEQIARLVRGTPAKAGTKLRRSKHIEEDLARAVALFGPSLERVLLHKPMPYAAYAVLEEARERGVVKTIGVCNCA